MLFNTFNVCSTAARALELLFKTSNNGSEKKIKKTLVGFYLSRIVNIVHIYSRINNSRHRTLSKNTTSLNSYDISFCSPRIYFINYIFY